ncbi:MAG: hypothetical protein XXXJIFNMEKO3_00353 [Candidatus Erwinia impunctatus]|nr:hypothetical protein XXXJIFNMEKO_00353 [Culicoides impunctatus]
MRPCICVFGQQRYCSGINSNITAPMKNKKGHISVILMAGEFVSRYQLFWLKMPLEYWFSK